MFSSILYNKPIYVNRALHDYCRKSTDESIRKQTEKLNVERNKPTIDVVCSKCNVERISKMNVYTFLAFVTISTMSFYFYKIIR
jgi:hypothetical protein